MKHLLFALLLLLWNVVTGEELLQQVLLRDAPSCDRKCLVIGGMILALILYKGDVLSCHWQGSVDSCCSPKYGLVVLALQWVPGYGPADEFTIHGV